MGLTLRISLHCWLATALAGHGLFGAQPEIRLTSIAVDTEFPESSEANSLRLACSTEVEGLRDFFFDQGVPFRPELVRIGATENCHVFYRSTIPGFRADSSDRPIQELFFSVETIRFLTSCETGSGDVLDIAKAAALLELTRLLEAPDLEFQRNSDRLRQAVERSRRSQVKWEPTLDGDLVARLDRFIDVNFPENRAECFTLEAQEGLLESDPGLLAEWVSTATGITSDTVYPQALLSVIESQIPGYRPRNAGRLDELAKRLSQLGFRVIRVPKIAGEPELEPQWSGISYTNLLVVKDLLLVPRFGFGLPEDRIFEELQAQLLAPFKVVPVDARRVLLFSGGIHCVTGIIYGAEKAAGGNE